MRGRVQMIKSAPSRWLAPLRRHGGRKKWPSHTTPKTGPSQRSTVNSWKSAKTRCEIMKNGSTKNWKVTFFGPLVSYPKWTKKKKKNIKKQAAKPKLKSVPKTTSITICMPIFLQKRCKKKRGDVKIPKGDVRIPRGDIKIRRGGVNLPRGDVENAQGVM